MSNLILHHYELSPFAEKIRLALGVKGLAWQSVDTPIVLPKVDHFELTGGYRRVPVLQIGADIYCDTHLITRVLDQIQPSPPLSPPGLETVEHSVSRWAETNFMMVIMAFFGIGGVFEEDFVEDRKNTMMPPGTNLDATKMIVASKLVQFRSNIARLEDMLADGRRFLLGEAVSAADLSAYHPLMLASAHERVSAQLNGFDRVGEWMARIGKIGHGDVSEIDSAKAIEIAKAAEPVLYEGEPALPEGMKAGDSVLVLPDEFGSGNVAGMLEPSGLYEIAVRRVTERAGEVVVHFPREDYALIAV